jgi:hypothetical protein
MHAGNELQIGKPTKTREGHFSGASFWGISGRF